LASIAHGSSFVPLCTALGAFWIALSTTRMSSFSSRTL
jgi:hypothetical protein